LSLARAFFIAKNMEKKMKRIPVHGKSPPFSLRRHGLFKKIIRRKFCE